MIKTIIKILMRFALAAGAVLAAFTVLQYLSNKKADYVEIYNDDADEELF